MHTEQHPTTELVAERTFLCTADQVGPARKWAAAVYGDAGGDPDVVQLLVSELATNAVLYSKGEKFQVRVHREQLWLEVCDESWDLPQRKAAGPYSENGRGLQLLDALAPGFEVTLRDHGKAVRIQPLTMSALETTRRLG